MTYNDKSELADTGERMIPVREGEVSVVFARHEFAYQFAQNYVSGRDVIDVGCGTGYGPKRLASSANFVLGIDKNADAIAYSRRHYIADNLQFAVMDARTNSPGRPFDVCIAFQVIEHMEDAFNFVDFLKRCTREGGTILISTPNVRHKLPDSQRNPFHFNEMNVEEFDYLLSSHFTDYRILGIGYASKNMLRTFVQKIPFYRTVGLALRRESRVKKVAVRALDLTSLRIIDSDVHKTAADLLAVCKMP